MNNEVAKELAEAFRDLCDFAEGAQYNREGYEIRGEELIARCRAALAKFDAEQGKAVEAVAWGRLGTIDGHLVLVDYQDVRYNHPWLPGAGNDLYNHPLYIHPVPVPLPVRAPAVVAAQGVTEEDVVTVRYDLSPARVEGKVRDKLIEMGWTPPETVAATRAQQGGEDARDARRYRWLQDSRRWFLDEEDETGAATIAWNFLELGEGTDEQLDAAIDAAIAAKEGKGND